MQLICLQCSSEFYDRNYDLCLTCREETQEQYEESVKRKEVENEQKR